MVQLQIRKWWVLLMQGLLLVILSIYIFSYPTIVLAGISLWFGFILVLIGVVGVFSWLFGNKQEREGMSFAWSTVTLLFGLFIVFNLLAAMKLLTVIFGLWILLSGSHVFKNGWQIKGNHPGGWLMVVIGALSLLIAIMMIFNIGTGAIAIAILLGLQVLLMGICLVVFSFAIKALQDKISDKIEAGRTFS